MRTISYISLCVLYIHMYACVYLYIYIYIYAFPIVFYAYKSDKCYEFVVTY